jgi:signal peptidase I
MSEDQKPHGSDDVQAPAPQTVTSATRTPIWSDNGDAPFEDGDEALNPKEKPIKANKIKGPKPARTAEPSAAGEFAEIVKTIVFALLIAFVLRVLLFQPFTIPSASMEPNLYEGDYIIVSKWSYGYSKYSSGLPINLPLGEGRVFGKAPERGDIVVFKLPRDNKTDYIKRVIGLPGDQIQMVANKLYINGAPVKDVVIGEAEARDVFGPRSVTKVRETLPNGKSFDSQDFGPGGDLDDTGVYTVPAGHYFMMGDNRDNSLDSRRWGFVPRDYIKGKAKWVWLSFDQCQGAIAGLGGVRWERLGMGLR